MKNTIALLLLISCCGCVQVSGTRKTADGSSLTISTTRFLWSSEGIDFSTSVSTNAILDAKLKVAKSSTDATSIKEVFTGLKDLGMMAK
jgi:hypothetical protein